MRTFIAIDLDAAIRKHLTAVQSRLRASGLKLAWVDPAKVHLTLKFLGEMSDAQTRPVAEAIDTLTKHTQPLEFSVGGLGVFPPSGAVRVVWVGVQDETGALAACQTNCEKLLAPLGFDQERRGFSPHLTLGRNKSPAASTHIRRVVADFGPLQCGIQHVDRLIFYHSTLTPRGSVYEPLSSHALAERGNLNVP